MICGILIPLACAHLAVLRTSFGFDRGRHLQGLAQAVYLLSPSWALHLYTGPFIITYIATLCTMVQKPIGTCSVPGCHSAIRMTDFTHSHPG